VVAKTHSVPRCMLEDSSGSWDDKLLLKSISSVHTTISGATSEDSSDEPCLDAWGVLRPLLGGDTAIWPRLLDTGSGAKLDIDEESMSCACEKICPAGTSFSRLR
jgi:hypothetical protein